MAVNFSGILPITATFTGNDYYSPSTGQGSFSLKSAKQLKQDALSYLRNIQVNSKQSGYDVAKAMEFINGSLIAALWTDASRLDSKQGHKVFDSEKIAVQELLKILEDKGRHADTAINDNIQATIDQLIRADNLLVKVAIYTAKNATIQSKFQKQFEHEISLAEKELTSAQANLSTDKQAQAIDSYREAWLHAQLAIKFGVSNKNSLMAVSATVLLTACGVFVAKKKRSRKRKQQINHN